MAGKRQQQAKLGFGLTDDPEDSIHMGEGKRIRLEDTPEESSTGDEQVGNRAYNDARYQLKGTSTNNQATFLEGGYWIYSGVGLIFTAVRTVLLMPGEDIPRTFEAVNIDLEDAAYSGELDNGTFPQYVRPMWDINEADPIAIFGIASADPGVPSVEDPLTQIAGDEFLLNAGATEITDGGGPGEVLITPVYDENLGTPDEFNASSTGPGTVDFNNTTAPAPLTNTKSIRATGVQQGTVLIFDKGVDFDPTDTAFAESFNFKIFLLASMGSGHNISVGFLDSTDKPISLLNAVNLDKSNVSTEQVVSVPMNTFAFNATNARKVRIYWVRTGGSPTHAGFIIDDIHFQSGTTPPIVQGDIELEGHVTGSGQTGNPIQTVITEKAISDQTEQTDPLPSTAEHLVRLADGSLRKVADSLIASNKVDKVAGKSLIDDTEIARLAGINDRFKGKYTSLAALETAVPTANAGDYAQVDTGGSNPVVNYNWDVEDGWVIGSTGGTVISNTDELPEGSTNLYFTATRVLNTIITGVSFVTNRAILATDSIVVALGLLQKQITDAIASIAGKQDTLVSETNIKTIDGNSLLGSGDLVVSPDDFTPQAGTALAFNGPNKYGFNGTALTGNLTFSISGAKETVMIKARHNAGTEPTVTPPGGVTAIFEGGEYVVSVDNILYAICHKNDAGTVTHISYNWTQNQA